MSCDLTYIDCMCFLIMYNRIKVYQSVCTGFVFVGMGKSVVSIVMVTLMMVSVLQVLSLWERGRVCL